MLFELILKSEYLIRLKKEGSDKELLSLLCKDMASAMSALDDAVGTGEENPAADTLRKIHVINKLLGTDFDLEKIKSNTPTFPKIKDLCEKSSICIKDYCGEKLYHFYVQWSWNNHSLFSRKEFRLLTKQSSGVFYRNVFEKHKTFISTC